MRPRVRAFTRSERSGWRPTRAIYTGTYNLRSMRREKSWQDLLRVNLDLSPPENAQQQGAAPVVKYTVAFNGASVWSAQNNQYVTLRAPTPKPHFAHS